MDRQRKAANEVVQAQSTMNESREDSMTSKESGNVHGTIGVQASADDAPRRVREGFPDLARLIRSIQRAEGNADCFQRLDSCGEKDCCWRPYCLNKSTDIL